MLAAEEAPPRSPDEVERDGYEDVYAGTAAAIPALLLTSGYRFQPLDMTMWIGALAGLGVFVAIPLKRQMINIEQLRFPTGIASAETVRSLHA